MWDRPYMTGENYSGFEFLSCIYWYAEYWCWESEAVTDEEELIQLNTVHDGELLVFCLADIFLMYYEPGGYLWRVFHSSARNVIIAIYIVIFYCLDM